MYPWSNKYHPSILFSRTSCSEKLHDTNRSAVSICQNAVHLIIAIARCYVANFLGSLLPQIPSRAEHPSPSCPYPVVGYLQTVSRAETAPDTGTNLSA